MGPVCRQCSADNEIMAMTTPELIKFNLTLPVLPHVTEFRLHVHRGKRLVVRFAVSGRLTLPGLEPFYTRTGDYADLEELKQAVQRVFRPPDRVTRARPARKRGARKSSCDGA